MLIFKQIWAFFRRKQLQIQSFNDSLLMHYIRFERFDKINFSKIHTHSLFYKNAQKETALSLCIRSDINEIAIFLINKEDSLKDAVFLDKELSPLMYSIEHKNKTLFKHLLDKGANINYVSPSGKTALSVACDDSWFLEMLVDHESLRLKKFPILNTNPLYVSSAYYCNSPLFFKMVELGFIDELNNQDIVTLCKRLIEKYEYPLVDKIINRIEVSENMSSNMVLMMDKEGFYNNKLLIKNQQFEEFFYKDFKTESFHRHLGLSNRDVIREFYQNMVIDQSQKVSRINTQMIYLVSFLKKNFNVDENLLRSVFPVKNIINIDPEQEAILKEIFGHYPIKRTIKVLTSPSSIIYLKDMIMNFELIKRFSKKHHLNPKIFLPKKPLTIEQISRKLEGHVKDIGKDKIPIDGNIPEYMLPLDQMKIGKYTIHIPRNNSELIEAGAVLSLCVGNNVFATQMALGNEIILIIKEKQKPIYCVEYSFLSKKIIQAKTYYNTHMNDELYKSLENLLLSRQP